eukprot:531125-Rhodomonas_salina.1
MMRACVMRKLFSFVLCLHPAVFAPTLWRVLLLLCVILLVCVFLLLQRCVGCCCGCLSWILDAERANEMRVLTAWASLDA